MTARAYRALALGLVLVSGAARILEATRDNHPEDTRRWAVERAFPWVACPST